MYFMSANSLQKVYIMSIFYGAIRFVKPAVAQLSLWTLLHFFKQNIRYITHEKMVQIHTANRA